MSWRLIDDGVVDIYRSLSVEEALAQANAARANKVNTLRFWIARPSVVLGRFQCLHEEVNIDFCRHEHISIARRFTGGGTVYHDEGNLNFALCMDQSQRYVPRTLPELYWTFIGGIARALQQIGVPACFDANRSCLRIRGKKITGTAGWIKRGVSFVHGTLLISADLEQLARALDVPPGQPAYYREPNVWRCLESRRDIVTTIVREVPNPPTIEELKNAIVRFIERISGQTVERGELSADERTVAEALYRDRYSRPEWNLGYRHQVSNLTATESLQ